jgi:hypothetical protein
VALEYFLISPVASSQILFSIRALMRALEQIHSARELVTLPASLFSAVRGLVSDARLSIDQLDLKSGFVTSVTSEDRLRKPSGGLLSSCPLIL